jgi:hypothetical protein
VARWLQGEQTIRFLMGRGRLESFETGDLTALAEALVRRATLRLEATAVAALVNGDIDGAYAAAYDAYRMAAEALLGREGLRATGGAVFAAGVFPTSHPEVGGGRSGTWRQCLLTAFMQADGTRSKNRAAQRPHVGPPRVPWRL